MNEIMTINQTKFINANLNKATVRLQKVGTKLRGLAFETAFVIA